MTPTPDQPDRRPIYGFVAGTPILTPDGYKPIEQLRLGDLIQSGPDSDQHDEQGDDELDEAEPPRWWEGN